jgi:hypothetical protein
MLKGENMSKRRIVKLFESRSGNLENRLKKDYIQNGVATIPCRVSDYNDVISNYSVKGFETLNQEFVDFIKEREKSDQMTLSFEEDPARFGIGMTYEITVDELPF